MGTATTATTKPPTTATTATTTPPSSSSSSSSSSSESSSSGYTSGDPGDVDDGDDDDNAASGGNTRSVDMSVATGFLVLILCVIVALVALYRMRMRRRRVAPPGVDAYGTDPSTRYSRQQFVGVGVIPDNQVGASLLFPSGKYTCASTEGSVVTAGVMQVSFHSGRIAGSGNDVHGAFSLDGFYSDRTQRVAWIAAYENGTLVDYRGRANLHAPTVSMAGQWTIVSDSRGGTSTDVFQANFIAEEARLAASPPEYSPHGGGSRDIELQRMRPSGSAPGTGSKNGDDENDSHLSHCSHASLANSHTSNTSHLSDRSHEERVGVASSPIIPPPPAHFAPPHPLVATSSSSTRMPLLPPLNVDRPPPIPVIVPPSPSPSPASLPTPTSPSLS